MTEAERRRLRARDLERRLRRLGVHCPLGALEPLEDERLTRSPATVTTSDRAVVGGPVMSGMIRRYYETPITVR